MVLTLQILYWTALLVWSGVLTYIILFIFFPEKVRHGEHHDSSENTAQFARHRFQKLPGNDSLTVNDIVMALRHTPASPEVTEEEKENQTLIAVDQEQEATEEDKAS